MLSNYHHVAVLLTVHMGVIVPVGMRMRAHVKNSLACNVCERGTYLSLIGLRVASVAAQGPHPATCGVIWSDHAAHLAATTPGR